MRWLVLLFLIFKSQCAVASETSFSDIFGTHQQVKEAKVVKVIASDTIVLEDGKHIRMIGIESYGAPAKTYAKLDKTGRPIEEPVEPTIPLETQALYFAQDLLENKKVRLEYDIDALDENRHSQAYVFLPDNSLANVVLLEQGFVRLKIRPPNLKYAKELRKAYQEARTQQRGFSSN